jgi:alkylmercury lyase
VRSSYTWCAWDAFFLPDLLGKSARVASTCEASEKPVRLSVSPKLVESVDRGSVCISFLTPDSSRFRQDIVQNFCHCNWSAGSVCLHVDT